MVAVAVGDGGDDIDLDGAWSEEEALVLVWGRTDNRNGVYNVSVADGWVLVDPQPTTVIAGALFDGSTFDPVLNSGVWSLYTYAEFEGGWNALGSVPNLGGNSGQVWGTTGWFNPALADNVWVVEQAIGFDLTGVLDPTTDPAPIPEGWSLAIFNQVDPTWNGIWEGTFDGVTPTPLLRVADLPGTGVIVSDFLVPTAETLMAPIGGGHIIAKAPDFAESSFTGLNGYFGLPTTGGGWVVVHSNSYVNDATNITLVAGRGVWPTYNLIGDDTPDANQLPGQVLRLAADALADATFTIPMSEIGGSHFRVHNPSDYVITLAPDTGVTLNVHGVDAAEVKLLPGAWAQVWSDGDDWIVTGDGFAYVHDGADYVPTFGCRTFIGPDDPAGDGFTLADGDQWKDTSA